ncbi:hypothetical protein SRHO_G00190490 [Serrasalmus rhombeus]
MLTRVQELDWASYDEEQGMFSIVHLNVTENCPESRAEPLERSRAVEERRQRRMSPRNHSAPLSPGLVQVSLDFFLAVSFPA